MKEHEPVIKLIIEEKFSPGAIEALMANYRDAQLAFLELIDNAIDNRIEGSANPLQVRVRVSRDELSVHNQGGEGLDLSGLTDFFNWGHSEKSGRIGIWGVGGKGAAGYLGQSLELVCSAKASQQEYKVADPNWTRRVEGETKRLTPEVKKAHTEDGYFRIRITNLTKEVNAAALTTKLGDIYRPLLLTNRVKIKVNGKDVEPLQIRYVENDPKLKPDNLLVQTRFGDHFELKVGIMEEGQILKPGIRCYYHGRLIEAEHFFGHPTPAQMPEAARLIGEVDFDFVPVTPNKSSFIHSSPQWIHASKRMQEVLTPWNDKLQGIKIDHRTPVENYEKELARKAKRVLEHVLATTGIITKTMLPGESEGRRPPGPSGKPKVKTGRTSSSRGPQEGQTAPVLDATIGEMKRWGALHEIDVAPMGNNGRRSEAIDEKGRKILKINSDHPLYQAEKKAGDDALGLYQTETAILKIAELATQGKSIEEYIELVDNLSRECGAVYNARLAQRDRKNGRRKK